jgi:hypothetical protein
LALRLSQIDELTRSDHSYLAEADQCYFIGEYTARAGYEHSSTNDLILNFKKPPSRRSNEREWRYKVAAVERAARMFREVLDEAWLRKATLCPVPPSKAKGDSEYDDRMLWMLGLIGSGLDVRELVLQRATIRSSHGAQHRPTPEELAANYLLDEACIEPTPRVIGVFDDLLTTGSHFVTMKQTLVARMPGVRVVGLFLARRVLPATT